jgi:hypothetical protein
VLTEFNVTDYFLPSASRANVLRSAMAASWHSSLAHSLKFFPDKPIAASIQLPPHWLPTALDYGAYFDLHLNALKIDPSEVLQVQETALQWLWQRFSAPTDLQPHLPQFSGLSIQALGPPDFSIVEAERLKRWLDTDAQQPLHLQTPDPAQVLTATHVLEQAWDLMAAVAPELRDEIAIVSPQVLLARSAAPSGGGFGGASSFCLWGCLALNAEALVDPWDGFVNLVHESAHGLLFAHARRQPLVLNPPEERYASPLRSDQRPMDGIFHAAFVSAREIWALRQALTHSGELPSDSVDPARDGLQQRLQTRESAFRACDAQLTRWGQLSDLGAAIIKECRDHIGMSATSPVTSPKKAAAKPSCSAPASRQS